MKKLLFILPAALVCFILMTGQNSTEDNPRWSIDPRSSVTYSNGDYTNLPSLDLGIKQFTFAPRTIITPIGVMVASPNVRVHPSSQNQQCETDIVRHPTNPNIMFASAQPIINSNNFINVGVYVTTDGGVTWNGRDTMNAPNLNDQRGDPAPIIDKNGTFLYGHLTSSSNFGGLTGMGANFSTDNGATWSSTFQIMSNSSVDKNMTGTDGSPSSPFYGNSYMAWTVFAGSAGDGRVSRTTNGGVSWDPVITLNSTPAGHFAQGHDVAVAPNGNVFVCWTAGNSTSPFTEDFVGIAKSTDGGVTYTATENAYDVNGSRSGSFNGWGIRTNGFPRIDIDKSGGPRNGWIYIVSSQINLAPAGSDADIILNRSTDNGATWTPQGIRVNQDAMNNGKVQFFPVVNVDDAGGLNVVYYDNRDFPSSGDSCSVYMSRSIDGGNTWTDVEVADHHFKPKNLPGINTMGDYIGVTSGNGKVWPVWMDDKAGPGTQFNIWTTNVQISTFPLNSFNLTSPPAGTRISTLPNSTTQYNFGWDTAASTASYKWIFGSPNASSRQITLPPSGNSLTVSGGQLDDILMGLGLNQGDSLVGQWDVWAFRNNATNDSMKANNGPRTITLKRARPSLTAFNLVSPPNNTTLLTLITNTTPVNINWTRSGEAVNYRWLYASPNFSSQANVKLRIDANNSGFDSLLTLRNSQIDSALAGLGVSVGDSSVGQWRVYGYSAGDSLSSSQTYNITMRRGIPPTVTSSADSIVVNVPIGGTASRNLIIGNTGQFSLDWAITESSSLSDNTKVKFVIDEALNNQQANLPKGALDVYHGPDVTDGMGGPDAFGYRWIDSDEPGGPIFNWYEISAIGTQITTWTSGTADDGSVIVPIPFNFSFYGTDYNQLKICTNGWVGFDIASTSNAYSNVAIPATGEPNNVIYPFWDDHDFRTSGQVFYHHDAANNRFVIEYKDAPHFSTGGPYTYQVFLYADGRIIFQYLNMNDPLNSATIGLENSSGTVALQVAYNAAYMHNNLAIKLEKGLAWVDETPSFGTITPMGTQNVSVNFNTTGLSIGSYNGFLNIGSNDPVTPNRSVRIKLNVGEVGIENTLTGVPSEFMLAQNYPNPFNPTTKISYGIPNESFVTIKIYDILGKQVMSLVNENKRPGYYDVNFNGSNFASGMYFYKIEAGSFVQTKRMILVK